MALKVGTEDKKKVYLATGLGLVMLILLVRFLWQTFGPSPAAPSRRHRWRRRDSVRTAGGKYDCPGQCPSGGKGGRLGIA